MSFEPAGIEPPGLQDMGRIDPVSIGPETKDLLDRLPANMNLEDQIRLLGNIYDDEELREQYGLPENMPERIADYMNGEKEKTKEKKKKEEDKIPEYKDKFSKKRAWKDAWGSMDLTNTYTNMRPESVFNQAIYYASQEKHNLIESLKENGREDLVELVELGADVSPILFYIRGKAPELFKPDEGSMLATKIIGYDGDYSEKEREDIAIKVGSFNKFKKYGPFAKTYDLRIKDLVDGSYTIPKKSIFSDLSLDEREALSKKVGDSGARRAPTWDPRLDPTYAPIELGR